MVVNTHNYRMSSIVANFSFTIFFGDSTIYCYGCARVFCCSSTQVGFSHDHVR